MMFARILRNREQAAEVGRKLREEGKLLVFTNGCFDLIHAGHIKYLSKARALGDVLIVGVNSDESVYRLKGEGSPIMPLMDRMRVLAALRCVDYVISFSEDTPENLITAVLPNILVKGGDYLPDEVVGKNIVERYGGKVVIISFSEGRTRSTSSLKRYLLEHYKNR